MSRKSWWYLAIVILALVIRLLALNRLPIFNDEAIYLHWGQYMIENPVERFYSLRDGKPPLMMWLFGMAIKVNADPLVAGRMISAMMGTVTLIGLILIGEKERLPRTTTRLGGLIYALSPLFVLYDRQALMEAGVALIGVWAYLLARQKPLLLHFGWLGLGAMWALGIWIKLNAIGFMVAAIVTGFYQEKAKLDRLFWLAAASVVMIAGIYILIVNGGIQIIVEMNKRYSLTIPELLKVPFSIWGKSILAVVSIIIWQMGGIGSLSLVTLGKRSVRKKVMPVIVWLVILTAMYSLLVRQPSPRYLVAFIPLLSLVIAHCLQTLSRKRTLMIGMSLGWLALGTALLISKPEQYFDMLSRVTANSQKSAYVTDYTAGHGVMAAINDIKNHPSTGIKTVFIDLTPGNPQSSVELYLSKEPGIQVKFWDNTGAMPRAAGQVYLITRDDVSLSPNITIKSEKRWYKPNGIRYVSVWEAE